MCRYLYFLILLLYLGIEKYKLLQVCENLIFMCRYLYFLILLLYLGIEIYKLLQVCENRPREFYEVSISQSQHFCNKSVVTDALL